MVDPWSPLLCNNNNSKHNYYRYSLFLIHYHYHYHYHNNNNNNSWIQYRYHPLVPHQRSRIIVSHILVDIYIVLVDMMVVAIIRHYWSTIWSVTVGSVRFIIPTTTTTSTTLLLLQIPKLVRIVTVVWWMYPN